MAANYYYRKAFAYLSDPARSTEYEGHEHWLEQAREQEQFADPA
jgi:hypothetical protein